MRARIVLLLLFAMIGAAPGCASGEQRPEDARMIDALTGQCKAAGETIAAARANVSQAETVLAMMQNNYKFGAATTLDLVDAQTAVSVAHANLLCGLRDFSVARANLLWSIGQKPWE